MNYFGSMLKRWVTAWTCSRLLYTGPIMPQFVIEREIPGAGSLSEAQIREVSLQSLQALNEIGPQIQWLHSYVTEDKVLLRLPGAGRADYQRALSQIRHSRQSHFGRAAPD
jgi:hypothetical protein